MQDTLAGQMQYAYFPVRLDQMGAKIRYHELIEGDFQIGDVSIRTRYLNHTALTLGFRLEADGAALVYASDHEPFQRHLASGNVESFGQDRKHCEFLAGADLVIHDAQFTLHEYADKVRGQRIIEMRKQIKLSTMINAGHSTSRAAASTRTDRAV